MYVIKPNFQGLQSFVQKIPLGQKCYKHTQLATAFYLFYFILFHFMVLLPPLQKSFHSNTWLGQLPKPKCCQESGSKKKRDLEQLK